MSFHRVLFQGHLGRMPELRYSPQGTVFCNFSVAVNDIGKDKEGNKIEEVTWYNVSCMGKKAEAAVKHLKKGDPVFISGKQKIRKYQGQNGLEVSIDVFAMDVQFLGAKTSENSSHSDSHDEEDNTDFDPEQLELAIATGTSSNSSRSSETNQIKAKGK